LPDFSLSRSGDKWSWGTGTRPTATEQSSRYRSFEAIEIELLDGYKGILDIRSLRVDPTAEFNTRRDAVVFAESFANVQQGDIPASWHDPNSAFTVRTDRGFPVLTRTPGEGTAYVTLSPDAAAALAQDFEIEMDFWVSAGAPLNLEPRSVWFLTNRMAGPLR
jgi:hypothetical protein